MRRRRFGRTGLEVTDISLGCVEIGLPYGIGVTAAPDYENAGRVLNRALDLGINYIDTARAYGESEAFIGRAIAHRRGEYVLASKVQVPEREAVETSLKLLRTDVIDIMMLHSAPLGVLDNGEAGEALLRLKEAGLFRFAGVSVYGNEAAMVAIRSGMFDCVQIAYSPLDRRPELGVLEAAERHDVGLIARSVLLKGALTHRATQLPEALAPIRDAAARLARFGALPELAYRYVLSQPTPQTALVGTADAGELEQAVGFAAMGPLEASVIEAIRAEPMLDEFFLNPGNWPPV